MCKAHYKAESAHAVPQQALRGGGGGTSLDKLTMTSYLFGLLEALARLALWPVGRPTLAIGTRDGVAPEAAATIVQMPVVGVCPGRYAGALII